MDDELVEHIVSSLKKDHSKETANTILQWMGDEQDRFDALVNIVAGDYPQKVKDRSSWVLSDKVAQYPGLMVGNWDILVGTLLDPATSHPIRRNLVRFMQETSVPEKHHGMVTNRCFEFINDSKEDIAVRAFSITVVYNMVIQYPDLKTELENSIHELIPDASTGLKNRAVKTLEKLDKLN